MSVEKARDIMDRHVAFHEAGHALMAVLFGRDLTGVSLTKRATNIDPAELQRIVANGEALTEEEAKYVVEDVKITMGGYLGELVGIGRAHPQLGSDLDRMNQVIKLLPRRLGTGFGLQNETRAELEAHQDALERIAKALLTEKDLSARQVSALMDGPVDNHP